MRPTVTFLIFSTLFTFINGEIPGLRFLLYTKLNKDLGQEQELIANNVQTISNSNFSRRQIVKFISHGFNTNYTQRFPQNMKNAYLSLPGTYNVIIVDWAALEEGSFARAAANTHVVGTEIAKLINVLIKERFSILSDFHHIGHSLGAQAGAFISSSLGSGRKLRRVTGLDPATTLFPNTLPISQRLDSTDAEFVDVIATSCRRCCQKGYPRRGTADFYPNGGIRQPGCEGNPRGIYPCSHSRAHDLYTESIKTKKGFKAYKCRSYARFQAGGCEKGAKNSAFMGEFVSNSIRGSYYLNTNADPPYAQGFPSFAL